MEPVHGLEEMQTDSSKNHRMSEDTYSTLEGNISLLTERYLENSYPHYFGKKDEMLRQVREGENCEGDAVSPPAKKREGSEQCLEESCEMQSTESQTESSKETEQSGGTCKSRYKNVIAVINPLSGNVSTSRHVLRSMRALLGPERVVVLSAPLFANPLSFQDVIRKYSVCLENDSKEGHSELSGGAASVKNRGTVIVSGGDGTVSFVMEQIDNVRETLESISVSHSVAPPGFPSRRFVLPAIAVLALGTGNDFSRCLGFGGGYSQHKCCLGCEENAVDSFFERAVTAPAVPFDRWILRFSPLESIQEHWRDQQKEKQMETNTETTPSVKDPINMLRLVEWDALEASGKCLRYNFMNYFSVGYDAYVLRNFDKFRRKHPKICGRRWTNKLVYASCGLGAAFSCSTLHRKIPSICVPAPAQPITKESERDASPVLTQMTLPTDSKVLLVSNVERYAAGTRPWQLGKGRGNDSSKMLTPVSINDHKVEVQALGGAFDVGLLQMGVKAAHKLAQSKELFLFFYCSPEDVFKHGENGNNASRHEKAKKKPESLCVQVDGEAVTKIVQPTVAQVIEMRSSDIYVRCLNPAVLRRTSKEMLSSRKHNEL